MGCFILDFKCSLVFFLLSFFKSFCLVPYVDDTGYLLSILNADHTLQLHHL